MARLILAHSTVFETDFFKPKPMQPRPKILESLRQRYRFLRSSSLLPDTIITEINDDGLCTRCAHQELKWAIEGWRCIFMVLELPH
jgi:hypothetical protein